MAGITHIDHLAIAVHRIDAVKEFFEKALGLSITQVEELPERGIRTAFIPLGQSMIELIEPMGENSEIAGFLEKRGPGLHHIALATPDIAISESHARAAGARLIYDEARPGAHATKVNFIHPQSSGGVLLELVEHSHFTKDPFCSHDGS